uniref:Uncharacterized protein n=1 Tax=Arundo donax TaxID=35708 RepID=A0A0A9ASH4_ARUDO
MHQISKVKKGCDITEMPQTQITH